jgi:hypothetical protein
MAIEKGKDSAQIAASASLSGPVNLFRRIPSGILMPAAWTTADLTFQGSMDTITWAEITVMPQMGVTLTSYRIQTPLANQAIPLDMAVFAPWKYIRVRSGTSGAPVTQAALRQLYVTTWGE